MKKKKSRVHVVGIFRRELTNRHESEALRNFFFWVCHANNSHEEKRSCVHVVGISRRELTNRHESEALKNFFGYVTQTIVT